ncbi:MAG: phosphotransferase family protein [Acidimicrobiales bacterium]
MSEQPTIDLEAATTWLGERYGTGVSGVAELTGGAWSKAFSFCLGGDGLVVRFGPYRDDYMKDLLAVAFDGPALPVPHVHEVGEALGGYYALSELHHGRFLETLDAARFKQLMPALLAGLDALRAVELPHPSGCTWVEDASEPDTTCWRDWLLGGLVDTPGDRVSGWRSQLAATPELDQLFVTAEASLHSLLGALPEIRHVLHLDLLNRNVLVAQDASRLEAVFDWGCLSFGDFVYEVAWFTFWSPWHAGLAAADFLGAIRSHYASIGLDVPDFEERLECYELHIGLTHLAYCTFAKLGDDLAGVAKRLKQILGQSTRSG